MTRRTLLARTAVMDRRVRPAAQPPADDVLAGLPDRTVLCDEPRIGLANGTSVTLREYLRHHRFDTGDGWAELIADIGRRCTADPVLSRYFADDCHAQRHALAALLMIGEGDLTVADVRRSHQDHRHVRSRDGQPVTLGAFDRFVSVVMVALNARSLGSADARRLMAPTLSLRDAVASSRPEGIAG